MTKPAPTSPRWACAPGTTWTGTWTPASPAARSLWSFARLTDTFREIHDSKQATIIIISHQERIIRLADEILLIAGGRLQDRGSVDEIYPKIMTQTLTGCNLLEVD